MSTSTSEFIHPDPINAARPPARPHLRAAMIVLSLLLLTGAVGGIAALALEKHYIHEVALEGSDLKDLSIVWQRAAMAEPDILPMYGSSELAKHFGNEPQRFFASYPTGFGVSPVGRGGCTSLILGEKIAAAAENAPQDRKLAISLSPSWFFHTEAHHRWYVGNFSAAQASALIFSPRLSLPLKRDFARRMLDYPDSVQSTPLLTFALHRLVDESWVNAALYRAVTPLARAQDALGRVTDHAAFAWHILRDHQRSELPPRMASRLDWEAIMAGPTEDPANHLRKRENQEPRTFMGDRRFAQVLDESKEWNDLELLMRVAKELKLDPLLLSIPIDYRYYQSQGISKESLDHYLARLHTLAAHYDMALIDFAEHQNDAAFFADHNDHMSARGWLYMNHALDFYYHGARHQRYFAPAQVDADQLYP